ncbi:hypothetical protein AAVH_10807 [Aphelenchoides avenae]|nr:hypothetical protein AAVH_10807 [Aphelenchus avenae]
MDSTLASLEDEVIAFAQQQTADLEALRSDLNALLDARRKAVESAATKLLQRVDELRTNSAAAQVSSSPAAMDVAVNVIERERSISKAAPNADDYGMPLPIRLQCMDADRLERALQAMRQNARFTDAYLASNKMQEDNIALLKNNVLYGELESTELFAVLCFIAGMAPVSVAVVSSDFFGAHANASQKDKDGIRSHDNIFCVHDDYEVLLMPVFVIDGQEFEHGLGHWIIGIYNRHTRDATVYNPALLGSVSLDTQEMIVKAVRTSLHEGEVEPSVECRFETHGYNKQLDATSCGFFVVLYSELYVFRGEDRMRIAGFDIDGYRRSVVGLVQHLYEEFVNGGPLVHSESGECNTPLAPSATSLPCGDSSSPDHAALTCEPQSEMLTASVVAQSTAQDRRSKAQSAAVSGVCAEDSSSIAVTPKPAARAANGFYSVPPLNLHETLDQHKQRATHPSQIISHCYACSSAFSGPNGTSCRPESGSDLTHSHSFCRLCVIDYFNRTETGTLRVAQDGGGVGCARLNCPQFLACGE